MAGQVFRIRSPTRSNDGFTRRTNFAVWGFGRSFSGEYRGRVAFRSELSDEGVRPTAFIFTNVFFGWHYPCRENRETDDKHFYKLKTGASSNEQPFPPSAAMRKSNIKNAFCIQLCDVRKKEKAPRTDPCRTSRHKKRQTSKQGLPFLYCSSSTFSSERRSAVFALAIRIRSAGAASTCLPMRPPLTEMVL